MVHKRDFLVKHFVICDCLCHLGSPTIWEGVQVAGNVYKIILFCHLILKFVAKLNECRYALMSSHKIMYMCLRVAAKITPKKCVCVLRGGGRRGRPPFSMQWRISPRAYRGATPWGRKNFTVFPALPQLEEGAALRKTVP